MSSSFQEGSNFKTHTGGKAQKPRRPSRPFMVDETPIVFSLEWLSVRGLAKFVFFVGGCYMAVDITRFLLYRMSPAAIPLQPSWTAEVVANTVQLVAPCRRFPSSDLVFTETAVINDTASYYNPQEKNNSSSSDAAVVSAAIQETLRHHRPQKHFADRLAEIRAFIGFCADKAADSIVFVSGGVSPSELDKATPPKDESEPITFAESHKDSFAFSRAVASLMKGNIAEIFLTEEKIAERKAKREEELKKHWETSGYRGDPFAFDSPSGKWPTKPEQDSLAQLLAQDQETRKSEKGTDLWGRKSYSQITGKSIAKPGVVSFTSTYSDNTGERQASGGASSGADFVGSTKYHEMPLIDADTVENQLQSGADDKEMKELMANNFIKKDETSTAQKNNNTANSSKSFFASLFSRDSDSEIKSVDQLPHRGGSTHLKLPKQITDEMAFEKSEKEKEKAALKKEKDEILAKHNERTNKPSGSEVITSNANSTDDSLNRFISLHFEPAGVVHSGGEASPTSIAPTELRVKCLDASQAGGTRSRCSVDGNVLCAPRHRAMLAALALLPDPLPAHLQVATFGIGPTAIASFMFKNFAAHIKRLDVVAEPSLFEHPGILDFGLTARHGPVYFFPAEEEKFLLRSDKKYDLLFVSAADKETGERGTTRLTGDYLNLIKKSLSSCGVAAIEMNAQDVVTQRYIQTIFGVNNVFFIPMSTNSSDLVALAAYALPIEGVWKRHIVARAEDISYTFKLPYDIAAHLPLSWEIW